MGSIFLKRTEGENPLVPYVLTTDTDKHASLRRGLGEVYVLPISMGGGFIVGCGREGGIHMPIAAVQESRGDLSQRVYDCVVKYGKRMANSMPERFMFVDVTGGPRELAFHSLGSS